MLLTNRPSLDLEDQSWASLVWVIGSFMHLYHWIARWSLSIEIFSLFASFSYYYLQVHTLADSLGISEWKNHLQLVGEAASAEFKFESKFEPLQAEVI